MYGVDLSGLGTLGKKSEAGFDRFFFLHRLLEYCCCSKVRRGAARRVDVKFMSEEKNFINKIHALRERNNTSLRVHISNHGEAYLGYDNLGLRWRE